MMMICIRSIWSLHIYSSLPSLANKCHTSCVIYKMVIPLLICHAGWIKGLRSSSSWRRAVSCAADKARWALHGRQRLWRLLCEVSILYMTNVSQKVLTFKFSVTLSNLNWFFKIFALLKACEICYKIHSTLPTSP